MWEQLVFNLAIFLVIYLVLCAAIKSDSWQAHPPKTINHTGLVIRLSIVFAIFTVVLWPVGINPGFVILLASSLPILAFDMFGFFALLGLPTILLAQWIAYGTLANAKADHNPGKNQHKAIQTDGNSAISELIGKSGITSTALRPAGRVNIEQQEHDARTQSGFIPNGYIVRVIDLRGSELIVREDTPPANG